MWNLYEIEYVAYTEDGQEIPDGYFEVIAVPSDTATVEIAILELREYVIGKKVDDMQISRVEIQSVDTKGTLHHVVPRQTDSPSRECEAPTRNTGPSDKALQIAAQIWCAPTTASRAMDSALVTLFANKLDEYIHALQWCGASGDFQQGGQARLGWEMFVEPLLGDA